ncbi:MAG: polyprenyl synthetase family protein [Vicinamibacteria bacterium]|nr:polyprenyl synthetase family protein [Vicinamibacteria bacterium]
MPESFQDYVKRQREVIDHALHAWLPAPPVCPPLLAEAMNYSLDAGGKRLRPILVLAAADAIVAAADRAPGAAASSTQAHGLALPAACAIELIHTYSLIHDDLPAMDDDTLRRGRPTLHVVYGDGIAILAGDGLLTEAFALLAREPRAGAEGDLAVRKLRVIERIAAAAGALGMVGGQAVDLEAAGTTEIPGRTRPSLDARGLQAMHAMKTGALIRASAVSGAIMAGGSDAQLAAVDRFASEVGLVFQIVDDILDVEGAADQLGKTAGKDAADDKPTYPLLFGLEQSRRLASEGIARAEAALGEAGLAENHLMNIARWVLGRKN